MTIQTIIIRRPEVSNQSINIEFQCTEGIKKYFRTNKFLAKYTSPIEDVPNSIQVIPLVMNLLPFSWLTDTVIQIDELDEVFYRQIHFIKAAFQEMYPQIKFRGSIIVARLINNRRKIEHSRTLQLFSGGVDAVTTYIRIKEKNPILLNIFGWHKDGIKENLVFNADKTFIKEFALLNDNHAYFVESNLCTIVNDIIMDRNFAHKCGAGWWFGFQHSMVFLGFGCVVGYHLQCDKIYIASSYTIGDNIKCASDPRIDNCVRCANLICIHDGYELNRQDKIRIITNWYKKENKQMPLRVCSFRANNCGYCEKCLRTELALMAEGCEELRSFGFKMDKSLKDNVTDFFNRGLPGLDLAHLTFWEAIIRRMGETLDEYPQNKELYQLLNQFPYEKEIKKSRRRYIKNNFFEIVIRRVKGLIKKVNI